MNAFLMLESDSEFRVVPPSGLGVADYPFAGGEGLNPSHDAPNHGLQVELSKCLRLDDEPWAEAALAGDCQP